MTTSVHYICIYVILIGLYGMQGHRNRLGQSGHGLTSFGSSNLKSIARPELIMLKAKYQAECGKPYHSLCTTKLQHTSAVSEVKCYLLSCFPHLIQLSSIKNNYLIISVVLIWKDCSNYTGTILGSMQVINVVALLSIL